MNEKICAVLIAFVVSATPAFAQSTTTQQAATQFRSAERAEAALNEEPAATRSRADYLRVIRSYERVYLITPHTAFADNALTSIARLYEAMNDPKNSSASGGMSETFVLPFPEQKSNGLRLISTSSA